MRICVVLVGSLVCAISCDDHAHRVECSKVKRMKCDFMIFVDLCGELGKFAGSRLRWHVEFVVLWKAPTCATAIENQSVQLSSKIRWKLSKCVTVAERQSGGAKQQLSCKIKVHTALSEVHNCHRTSRKYTNIQVAAGSSGSKLATWQLQLATL